MVRLLPPLLGLVVSLATLAAQTPAPAPKLPPLPKTFALDKKYTYREPKAPEGDEARAAALRFLASFARPAEIDIEQTGAVRRERVKMTDGSNLVRWKSGQVTFSISGSTPDHIAVSAPWMDLHEVAVPGDFDELGWIKESTPVGEATKNGKKCQVLKAGENLVWMDLVTGLPVQFESPTMTVSYTLKNPPAEPLVLPEACKKRLEEITRAWAGRPN